MELRFYMELTLTQMKFSKSFVISYQLIFKWMRMMINLIKCHTILSNLSKLMKLNNIFWMSTAIIFMSLIKVYIDNLKITLLISFLFSILLLQDYTKKPIYQMIKIMRMDRMIQLFKLDHLISEFITE